MTWVKKKQFKNKIVMTLTRKFLQANLFKVGQITPPNAATQKVNEPFIEDLTAYINAQE